MAPSFPLFFNRLIKFFAQGVSDCRENQSVLLLTPRATGRRNLGENLAKIVTLDACRDSHGKGRVQHGLSVRGLLQSPLQRKENIWEHW